MRTPGAFFIALVAWSVVGAGCATEARSSQRRAIGSDFGLAYSPMFSAFEPEHLYQLPLAVQGGRAVDAWEIVDAAGSVLEDAAEFGVDTQLGETVLTVRMPGDYFVIAHAGELTGCAELHVTEGTAGRWQAGESRYHKLVTHAFVLPSADSPMQPMEMSCKECHGDGTRFLAPPPTIRRTAGYSDEALIELFTRGVEPTPPQADAASPCTPYAWPKRETTIPASLVRYFHTWEATEEDEAGLVQYLRSIATRPEVPIDSRAFRP